MTISHDTNSFITPEDGAAMPNVLAAVSGDAERVNTCALAVRWNR